MKEMESPDDFDRLYGQSLDQESNDEFVGTLDKGNKMALDRLDLLSCSVAQPRAVSILTKDYLERSCCFINPKHIRSKNLARICILASRTVLLKKILSLTFWLFVHHVQSTKKKFKK